MKAVNKTYQIFFITRNFLKKGMWSISCISLMYAFPMLLEYMAEQTVIMNKLMMQMGDQMPGGPPMGM